MIDYTPANATTAGDVVVMGTHIGICHRDIAANSLGSLSVGPAVYSVPKVTAQTYTLGADVYWDAGNTTASSTSANSTFPQIGYAAAAYGNTTTRMNIVKSTSL